MVRTNATIVPGRIREEMRHKGLRQKKLAEIVGVTESAMSRYCIGERAPSYATIKKIAEALNTTPEYLLGIELRSPEESYSQTRAAVRDCADYWTRGQVKELINELLEAL